MQRDTRFERNPEVNHRRITKDEFILLPSQVKKDLTRPFYFLEEVGGRIWELLDGKREYRKIAERIASEFCVKQERVEKEIKTFLSDLEKEKLIRRVSWQRKK